MIRSTMVWVVAIPFLLGACASSSDGAGAGAGAAGQSASGQSGQSGQGGGVGGDGGTAGAGGEAPGAGGSAGAGAGTTGTFACGATACKAGTECCVSAAGGSAGAPTFGCKAVDSEECKTGWPPTFCDDATDCPDGQLCCGKPACSCGYEERRCQVGACTEGFEACVPGGSCSSPELTCKATLDAAEERPITPGRCEVATPHVTCGDTTCEGASPVCCWDRTAQTGQCVATYEACHQKNADDVTFFPFECFSKADCGNYYRCASGPGESSSACSNSNAGGFFCGTVEECPVLEGVTLQGCVSAPITFETPVHPPDVKICRYL
jgi:hypothetical protein